MLLTHSTWWRTRLW